MRSRGFSLIELLVALVLLALAIAGLVALWVFGFNTTAHSQDIGVAYSIARQEIENARGVGYMRLPEGTWANGYDGQGHRTDANPHFTATATVVTDPLADGAKDSRCRRTLTVEVTAQDRRGPIFDTTTYFTRGGI